MKGMQQLSLLVVTDGLHHGQLTSWRDELSCGMSCRHEFGAGARAQCVVAAGFAGIVVIIYSLTSGAFIDLFASCSSRGSSFVGILCTCCVIAAVSIAGRTIGEHHHLEALILKHLFGIVVVWCHYFSLGGVGGLWIWQ